MHRAHDVVVIGAGAFGTSVAYHLTRAGLSVALVDHHGIATQTSPRAAGLTAQAVGPSSFSRSQQLSISALLRFREETGEPLEVHASGSVKLARSEDDAILLEHEIAAARGFGVEVAQIAPREVQELIPYFDPVDVVAASYTPTDVYFEPARLPLGYGRAALRAGAVLYSDSPAEEIVVSGGKVQGVKAGLINLMSSVVVDTAGAWARGVAALAGVRLPLIPVRHQLMITEPLPGVTSEQPIVRIPDAGVYTRPANGGLLLGGYEPVPVILTDQGPSTDFDVAALELDLSVLKLLSHQVEAQFPILRDARTAVHRGGIPTMTPDGLPLVGALGPEGLYACGGCCVAGLSISPAVGKSLAALILGEQPPVDLAPFNPLRFDEPGWTDERIRVESIEQYAFRYRRKELAAS